MELKQPGLFQRILKKEPQENAFIRLNNLFATTPLQEIKLEEVVAISTLYKVDFRKKFLDKLQLLYRTYLQYCFIDKILTDEELNDIGKLKDLLSLKSDEVEIIHNSLAGELYKEEFNKVISDGKIDKQEEEFLEKLKNNLRLPENIIQKISEESRKQFVEIQLGKIIEDGKISPDEWEEFTAIARNLSVDLNIGEVSKQQLNKLKLFWLIENGELPIANVPINLQKNEFCYYYTEAEWLETRTITQRINYGGPTARIRIIKGVYYRAGSMSVQRITSEQQQVIDSGTLYVTNKRIIFVGNKKNTNIPLGKILSVEPFSDGVGIEKDSGKSPALRVSDNADIFAMTLARVINDLQS